MLLMRLGYSFLLTALILPLFSTRPAAEPSLVAAGTGLLLGISSLLWDRRLFRSDSFKIYSLIALCLLVGGMNLFLAHLYSKLDRIEIVNLSSQPITDLEFQSPDGTIHKLKHIPPRGRIFEHKRFLGEGNVSFRLTSLGGEQSGILIPGFREEAERMWITLTFEDGGSVQVLPQ